MKQTLSFLTLGLLLLTAACSFQGHDGQGADVAVFGGSSSAPSVADIISRPPVVPQGLPEMPGDGCVPLKIKPLGDLAKLFNDSNYVHWEAAEKIGIEPLTDTRSFWHLKRPLVKIASCANYYVDSLTHSRPFLVPEAAEMVDEVGRRFRDSLAAHGGGNYRIRITSVLRTPATVRRLRRVNRNAVDSSVHQLATTVDISYYSFVADDASVPRRQEDLKAMLAAVLLAMRDEGKCFVKYERQQPCFHISVRPRQ